MCMVLPGLLLPLPLNRLARTAQRKKLEKAITAKDPTQVIDTLDDIFESSETVMIDERFLDLAKQTGDRKIITLIETWVNKERTPGKAALIFDAMTEKLEPGHKMPDGTIFIGVYTPIDRQGNSLHKTFNAFAAPQDLGKAVRYTDAVKHIKTVYGPKNTFVTKDMTDEDLFKALHEGRYDGEWFIPPHELLYAQSPTDLKVAPHNVFSLKDKTLLKGAFKNISQPYNPHSVDNSHFYWTCTKGKNSYRVINMSNGDSCWAKSKESFLSCRLMRLVEIKKTVPKTGLIRHLLT